MTDLHTLHTVGGGAPLAHTLQPTVTGGSVVGVVFDGGVMVAADMLASYGSLRRFDNVHRLLRVGEDTVVGVGGDVSDMQSLADTLKQLEISDGYDGLSQPLRARNVHSYLQRLYYQRRSKLDPLWNALLVAGFDNGAPYLAYVDLLGVSYTAPALASGLGSYLATPLLRNLEKLPTVTEEDARKALDEAMRVLFYRDCRGSDKYTVATIRPGDVKIEEKVVSGQNWEFAKDIKGFS